MDMQDLLSRFAVALGIGLLIGLERGWRARDEAPGMRTAGIRTFAITGLLGGVIGALAQSAGSVTISGALLFGISFAAYVVVISLFMREQNRAEGNFSATTAVANMVTFALGAYAVMGDMHLAAAIGVATAGLLAGRERLHGLVAQITWPELRGGLVLLAMTFIALPLVPNKDIADLAGLNPREVWLIAIVLAGVSFLGYVGVKHFGAERGVVFASLAGGLVSSTAVAVWSAQRAAAGEGAARLLAAGVAFATSISLIRVLAIVTALQPALLSLLAAPLLAGALVAVSAGGIAIRMAGDGQPGYDAIKLRNPFGLVSVVAFALLLGAMIVAGRLLAEQAGPTGAILGALAMGLADVDAITVSMSHLEPAVLSPEVATYAILTAVAANTISKLVLAAAIERGRLTAELAVVFAAMFVAAGAGLWAALLIAR